MAKLIYPINVSLDGYMEDAHGSLDWSISDDEVFAFCRSTMTVPFS